MATGKVSKRTVDALQPGPRNDFLWDAEVRGFGVKVTPAGAKSYIYQYRMGGRGSPTRRYTIGKHGGGLTPDLARDRAKELAAQVVQGVDPLEKENGEMAARQAQAKRAAAEVEQAAGATVRAAAERFVSTYVKVNWRKAPDAAAGPLRRHVLPAIGDKALADVTKADVVAMLDRIPIEQTGARRQAYAVACKFFTWAVSRDEVERSPMYGVEAPPLPASRDRVLSDDELGVVWRASMAIEYPFGPMYRLLILTGQRRDEVSGLPWPELDRTARLWRLSKERAKNGVAHDVHLSDAAVAELDALAGCADVPEAERKWPRRGFVFTTTGKTAVSGYSRAKRRLDSTIKALSAASVAVEGIARTVGGARLSEDEGEAVEMPGWVIHDLRRTLATGLQRLGVRFEVTEAVLNHVSGSKSGVAGVYQRHGWSAEKRAALDAWAAHVALILAPAEASNVVSIARRA